MIAANHIRPRLDELAGVSAVSFLCISLNNSRQVEGYVR